MSVAPQPERPDDDYEARFADIIARWDDPPAPRPEPLGSASGTVATSDSTPAAPSDDDAAPADPDRMPPAAGTQPVPESRHADLDAAPAQGWRTYTPPEEQDDEDEDFTPPPPAPLPRGELTFWVALVGLVAGPLWLIYLVTAQPGSGTLPVLLAILITFSGFAALVARSPRRRADDEEDDDGAVL